MMGINEILGRSNYSHEIINYLRDIPQSVWLIGGPSGVGKTELGRQCALQWLSEPGNLTLTITGDALHLEDSYWPFERALDESLEKKRLLARRIPVYDSAYRAAGAGLLSGAIRLFLEGINTHGSRLNIPQQAFRYLAALKAYAGGNNFLLVIDDAQYLDKASLLLIKNLLSSQAKREFPFLDKISCLVLFKGPEADLNAFGKKISEETIKISTLSYPGRHQIQDLMEVFGSEQMWSETMLDQLYAISHGHLTLLKTVAVSIRNTNTKNDAEFFPKLLKSSKDLVDAAVRKRLSDVSEGEQLHKLLTALAVIGQNFDIREIHCITKQYKDATVDVDLDKAIKLGLLQEYSEKYRFEHEVIHAYFLNNDPQETKTLNLSFEDCLRILRPGSYRERARRLLLADQKTQSLLMECADYLSRYEQGAMVPADLFENLEQTSRVDPNYGWIEAIRSMFETIDFISLGNPSQASSLIGKIPRLPHQIMQGWRIYLVMRVAIKTRRTSAIEAALYESAACSNSLEAEFDVWMRVKGTEIICYSYLSDLVNAQKTYQLILEKLHARTAFDLDAPYQAAVLMRRSASLFNCERAVAECRNSVHHFSPPMDGDLPAHPTQLFLSLTNLSGNLISAGAFGEAMEMAQKALNLMQLPLILFNGNEIAASNYLIAAYLAGACEKSEASAAYDTFVKNDFHSEDLYLIKINQAVLYADSGRLFEGCNSFLKLWEMMDRDDITDKFYRYLLATNAAWAFFQAGQPEEALKFFNFSSKDIPSINEADEFFLKKRHQILRDAFTNELSAENRGYQPDFLKDSNKLGPPWSYWGRAYLPTDIQFWSMS